MADNFRKLWFQQSLNQIAITRAMELIQNRGKALPCRVTAVNGSIVTVAFEVDAEGQTLPSITIPKNESQWVRAATQVGDFGVTEPCDVYLGGVSGLGGGTASISQQRGNLATLMFTPCGSTNFPAWGHPNKTWINGPAGAVLSTTDMNASVTVSEGSVVIVAGGNTWTFNGTGLIMSTGIVAETHQHQYIPGGNPPQPTGPPEA